MDKAIRDLRAGLLQYPVWIHQAYHVLGAKYKRTIMGTLWIAGNFLFTSLAITLVFGALFKQDLRTLLPYTMLGNLTGTLCLWILSEAPEMFIGSSNIIKNHAYPFTYFAFEATAKVLMLFGHNLVVFYIFMVVNQTINIPHWSVIPGLIVVTITMLTWGTIFGMMSARFRDLRYLLPNLANLFFFLTPLYWHVELLGEYKWIADVNPLYNLVSIIRFPLLGQSATALNWTYSISTAALGLIVWFVTFILWRRRIPFWV